MTGNNNNNNNNNRTSTTSHAGKAMVGSLSRQVWTSVIVYNKDAMN